MKEVEKMRVASEFWHRSFGGGHRGLAGGGEPVMVVASWERKRGILESD